MPTLTLEYIRFRMDHNVNYQGNEPTMKLISKKGYVTTGFLRGANLAVGQIVHAKTSDDRHHWTGWIAAQGLPDTMSDYPAFFFVLYPMRESTGSGPGDGVTVAVTVTDPTNPTQTVTQTAVPTPTIADVP